MLAVSLDCSGAFDCIKFDSAEKCMREKGILENINRWYVNLLKARIIQAEVQGQKTYIRPHRGSPQGGVLSPLIWNLIMDSLLSTFEKDPVKVLGYADDILLYVIGKVPYTLANIIQPTLDRVLEWGKMNGLTFNPAKTSMVMFTRSRKMTVPDVYMEGTRLEPRDSFKYLGVEIQQSLSWNKHVTERMNKCKYLLSKCRNLISRSWGFSPRNMDWVHKAIIRPKLTYGSVVWSHSITKGAEKKLDKVQRLALVVMTQPLRSTPTAGLEAMMEWIPLSIHSQEVGMHTYQRIKDIVRLNWDGIGKQKCVKGHLEVWKATEDRAIGIEYPRETPGYEQIWVEQCTTKIQRMEYELAIYTDASKEKDNVGYGWLASIGNYVIEEEVYIAKDISVYKAEMLAIKEALSWLCTNIETDRHTVIYSDSKSSVTRLNGYLAKDDVTKEAMSLLKELNELTHTEVRWVKGHSDNTGNELADMIAKIGAIEASKISDVKPYMPVTRKEIKKKVHEYFKYMWQTKWNKLKSCRISKLFYPTVGDNKKTVNLRVKELHEIAQVVTGHGLFKRHLQHWNEIDSYQCSLCGEADEDSWHLWEWCPALTVDRFPIRSLIEGGMSLEHGVLKWIKINKKSKL